MKEQTFTKEIKEEILDRLDGLCDETYYICDLGYELSMTENINGSWYCSAYEAKEALKRNFDEMFKYIEYERDNFGEVSKIENPETFQCRMYINAVNVLFNSLPFVDDNWNKQIQITGEIIQLLKKEVIEIDDNTEIF